MMSLGLPIPSENALTPQKLARHSNIPRINGSGYKYSQTHLIFNSSNSQPVSQKAVPRGTEAVREEDREYLPEGLRREMMPKHVAIIMDGNGRWARQRGMPPGAGHQAGIRSLKACVELCAKWGIKVLTVFAFSYDNWIRPKVEVEFLMSLFEGVIKSELDELAREGIRISVIGDTSRLPETLQRLISEAEEKTKEHSKLQLIVAASYSGKYDVVQACRSVAEKVRDGVVRVEDIDEAVIEQELETNCTEFPNPDLMIRTSGELRVSNFLLWQLAYTELFFAPQLWPDFGEEAFLDALVSFQNRQRRYGGRI